MSDPSEMLICSNQSLPEGYFCFNPSLPISKPAKAPFFRTPLEWCPVEYSDICSGVDKVHVLEMHESSSGAA